MLWFNFVFGLTFSFFCFWVWYVLYVPYEYSFLSRIAFKVYEVVRVACQSHSWFVLHPPGLIKETDYAADKRLERLRKRYKPCKRETSTRRVLCMVISLKQKKIKFKPRIKLDFNIYIQEQIDSRSYIIISYVEKSKHTI